MVHLDGSGSGSPGSGLRAHHAGHGSFSPYRCRCAAVSRLPPRTSTPKHAECHAGAVPHRRAGKCFNDSGLEQKPLGKAPYPVPEQNCIEMGDIYYLHGQELKFSMFGKK